MEVITNKIGQGISWLAAQLGIPTWGQFFWTLAVTGRYIGLIIAIIGFILSMPRLSFSEKLIKVGFTLIIVFGGIEIAFY